MKKEQKEKYESPSTRKTQVNLENGFMSASVFEDGTENAKGVTIEEHGFANPGAEWEGDYSESTWD
ncbi:uncharacterized protein BN473_01866 [Prevotella sp. CAG:1185]|nr:uncharacterized protein BN473_01866 [Prevotella sp. CAG:1185]